MTGDRVAFSTLAYEVSDRLYAVAYRILRDSGLAEDALQNTLVTAWKSIRSLRDADRFEAWIHRVLVHEAYAEARSRSRQNDTVQRIATVDESVEESSAVLDRDAIERAFRRLSPEHRAVFVLHYYVGQPLVEVAATLGIPAGTARSRLHYASQVLRNVLLPDRPGTLEEAGLA